MQTGTNLEQVKDYNQGLVLQLIRAASGVSRVEIAHTTGLTPQTVSNIVGRLIGLGLVVEVGKEKAVIGKPRTTVRVNPAAGFAIGARIGRRDTVIVLVDLDGRVVARTEHPTRQAEGPSGIVRRVADAVERLVRDAGTATAKVIGLGVACPGPLDHATGVVYSPPRFLGWGEVPLRAMMEQATGYPVVVDNNARASAVWERWAGAARHSGNFVFVYVGSGIGSGIFLDGQLRRGVGSSAGGLGHFTLDPDGPPCECGGRGCVNLYAAPRRVVAAVGRALGREEGDRLAAPSRLDTASVDFDVIVRIALAGNELALREIRYAARMLGHGVANLTAVLDVRLVILGGWVIKQTGDLFRAEIERLLRERPQPHDCPAIEVKQSASEEDTAAIGAATLVLHEAFAPRLIGSGQRNAAAGAVAPPDGDRPRRIRPATVGDQDTARPSARPKAASLG